MRLTEGNSVLLDLVRGVAAQLVVIGHGLFLFDVFNWNKDIAIQEIAVVVFFVLSGFIITYSSYWKKKSGFGFQRYLIDRFSRIYPPLLIALLFALLVDYISVLYVPDKYPFYQNWNFISFFGTLFNLEGFPFVSKILSLESFGTARPTWSLAIEWWIYICFGYIYFKHTHTYLKTILLMIFLLSPFANLVNENALTISWVFGLLVFYGYNSRVINGVKKSILLITLVFIILTITVRYIMFFNEYDVLLYFLIASVLLIILELFKDWRFNSISKKIIIYNAKYSYTLYLTHVSVLYFLFLNGSSYNKYLLFTLGILFSNLISYSLGYIGEEYLSGKIKMRLYKKFHIK